MPQRPLRPSLDGQQFDIVIIGGGINGVAIARQCALADRRVLLLEQHDFAAGTTSRSTRIIHGGLRYLQHGELGLVRESLRERQRLLQERPHLVRPMNFVLAIPERGVSSTSAMQVRLGLWLYRRLAGRAKLALPARTQSYRAEQWLDSGHGLAIFNYEDAQCEFPERLVAEWLGEALAAGAVARNHSEVLEVEVTGGRVRGVVFRDRLGDAEVTVTANWVINATGPWIDRICGRSGVSTAVPLIGGVRGSHIVLSKFAGSPDTALYTEAVDGRPIFIIPWNGQLLAGTTEIPDNGDPAHSQPSDAEIEYLIDSVNRLFPSAQVSADQVHYVFAGIRPLPYKPDASPAGISRKHILHDHREDGAEGMISVIGGKLTTAAALARDCARRIGIPAEDPSPAVVLGSLCEGLEATLADWSHTVARISRTSAESARAIAEWHGRRALAIACMAGRDDALRQRLCPHSTHLVAEAVEAVHNECAVSLGDILLRRVPVALSASWSAECSREAARQIAAVLGWSEKHLGSQLEQFEIERSHFLKRPVRDGEIVSRPA